MKKQRKKKSQSAEKEIKVKEIFNLLCVIYRNFYFSFIFLDNSSFGRGEEKIGCLL